MIVGIHGFHHHPTSLPPSLPPSQVLTGDPSENPQVHACKLLEVLVLQCQGRIDPVSWENGVWESKHRDMDEWKQKRGNIFVKEF